MSERFLTSEECGYIIGTIQDVHDRSSPPYDAKPILAKLHRLKRSLERLEQREAQIAAEGIKTVNGPKTPENPLGLYASIPGAKDGFSDDDWHEFYKHFSLGGNDERKD